MPTPSPLALRRRITDAYAAGGTSMTALAARFAVSAGSVERFVKRHRDGLGLSPSVRAQPVSRLVVKPEHEAHIDAWIKAEPSIAQHLLAARLSTLIGRTVSQQTAGQALRRMGYTYKKKRYVRRSN